ncbi:unnamed protein product [Parnassius mnemosyne]|uniref:Uncharacterized protein n=1 Tax=Parnassius mnemosyne TaxID=213953 RepID=A0AAV1LMS1_9NEOP
MALTHIHLAIFVIISKSVSNYAAVNISSGTPPVVKPILNTKRRNDIVDEAFMEQKDVLLDMLETKLKEVRDKKKKKGDRSDILNINNFSNYNGDSVKCEPLPKNVDLKVNAHGISAIGETDVKLKFGETGNGTLNLDATGISNIGQTHVDLGVGDGSVHIPGLNNIFVGPPFQRKACELINQTTTVSSDTSSNPVVIDLKDGDGRRMNNDKFNNTVTLESNSTTTTTTTTDSSLHANSTEKLPLNNKQNNDTGNAVTPN